MYMINRSAAVVKPKQAFVDWLMSCPEPPDPDFVREQVTDDCNVYLLPEFDTEEETADESFEILYGQIAEAEFMEWYTDEDLWPDMPDYAAFKKLFDVEIFSMVYDIFKDPIRKELY